MTSFRKASKSSNRMHRERSQPEHRKHLGILEKKKDYRFRAEDHQQKEAALKRLRKKALSRNPDEFYFKMINTALKEGVHQCEENQAPAYTEEQLKLLATQDVKFVRGKRQLELKKIEKLRACLHLIDKGDVKPKSHILFVDSPREAKQLKQTIKSQSVKADETIQFRSHRLSHLPQVVLNTEIKKSGGTDASNAKQAYRQLQTRLRRVEQLDIVLAKMELKRKLMSDDAKPLDPKLARRLGRKGHPKLVVSESTENAAVYMWPKRRQK